MASVYENSYMIVLIFLLLGILLPVVALTLGKMLRPNKPSAAKATTYESGIEPFHDARIRFNARYYIFALMFVIFDVETVFLYPWAVAYDKLGLFALIEMLIFVMMLLVGLSVCLEKEGVTMDINLEEFHPQERAELERNIFFSTLEQVEGMGTEQFFMADDIWTGLLCD